jgi:hypothetical protein
VTCEPRVANAIDVPIAATPATNKINETIQLAVLEGAFDTTTNDTNHSRTPTPAATLMEIRRALDPLARSLAYDQ